MSSVRSYMGMIAIAVVAVLVIGALGVRIDRGQERELPPGINATPAISGNAPDGLVDARWLIQYSSQVDYIFDLSDIRLYEEGHIPGAHHIWWQDAMRLHTANYGEADQVSVVSNDEFGKLNLGVPQNARIVLYDANSSERASWLLWVMRLNSYNDTHVLDGGLSAWIGAGGELSTEPPEPIDPGAIATPTWDTSYEIRREPLLESLDDPNVRLIDTRSAEEQLETVNGTIREGHIPGSINIPTAEVMREDGTFRSPQELRELFEAHGIEPEHNVIVYSLFTIHSGNLWLALQIAGYDNVVIYQEGWVAWGHNSSDLPVETEPYSIPQLVGTPDAATPVPTPDPTTVETPQTTPDDDGPTDLTGLDLDFELPSASPTP